MAAVAVGLVQVVVVVIVVAVVGVVSSRRFSCSYSCMYDMR